MTSLFDCSAVALPAYSIPVLPEIIRYSTSYPQVGVRDNPGRIVGLGAKEVYNGSLPIRTSGLWEGYHEGAWLELSFSYDEQFIRATADVGELFLWTYEFLDNWFTPGTPKHMNMVMEKGTFLREKGAEGFRLLSPGSGGPISPFRFIVNVEMEFNFEETGLVRQTVPFWTRGFSNES